MSSFKKYIKNTTKYIPYLRKVWTLSYILGIGLRPLFIATQSDWNLRCIRGRAKLFKIYHSSHHWNIRCKL